MASGRRDYTWGFLNEAASEGRFSQTYKSWNFKSIPFACGDVVWSYTVPAGYKLSLSRIEVCSSSRIRNWVYLFVDGAIMFSVLFDSNYAFIVSDKNPLSFEAGQLLVINCANLDEQAYVFYSFVTGVLEQVT